MRYFDPHIHMLSRTTDDYEQMAADYASERRAAGRSVPKDVTRLVDGRKVWR